MAKFGFVGFCLNLFDFRIGYVTNFVFKKEILLMATEQLDCVGLKCPQPTLKMTVVSTKMKTGDILEITADCPTFEKDLRDWCQRSRKTLLWIRDEGEGKKRAQIRF